MKGFCKEILVFIIKEKFSETAIMLLILGVIPALVHFSHHGDTKALDWSIGLIDSLVGALLLILRAGSSNTRGSASSDSMSNPTQSNSRNQVQSNQVKQSNEEKEKK